MPDDERGDRESLRELLHELGRVPVSPDEDIKYETRNELVEEKRNVIRNQIDVIRHQHELAFSVIKLNITLLAAVLGFLVTVLVLQREGIGDALEGISTAEPTTGGLFFISVIFLVGVFLYYSIIYSYKFMMDSLNVIRSRQDDWGLDTTDGVAETAEIGTEDILENQTEAIAENSNSIENNGRSITEFAEDGVNIVTALAISLSIIVLLGVVSQLIFVPKLLIGGFAILVGASGIPCTKFVLDHYV